MSTARKSEAIRKQPAMPKDAISLLKADHESVSELFDEFENARSAPQKKLWSRKSARS